MLAHLRKGSEQLATQKRIFENIKAIDFKIVNFQNQPYLPKFGDVTILN